ncbi:hypothetical protein, partial [Kingella denitrificans]
MPFISAFRVQAAFGKLKKQPANVYLKKFWAIGIAESSKSSLHALLRERAGCFLLAFRCVIGNTVAAVLYPPPPAFVV